jgi:hypothetical protein
MKYISFHQLENYEKQTFKNNVAGNRCHNCMYIPGSCNVCILITMDCKRDSITSLNIYPV